MTAAIILAGGLGTRLRSVVEDRPKPMALVQGVPFLQHQMDFWLQQGVQEFILSVGYMAECIRDYFGDAYQGLSIKYAYEEKPLGTGGGVLLASSLLRDSQPFLLLNGDTFFDVRLDELLAYHAEKRSDWTFSLFRAQEDDRYMGLDCADDGRIHDLGSQKGKIGSLANGGVYLVDPQILGEYAKQEQQKISLEDELLPDLLRKGGNLYGMECSGRFIDIGVPTDYARAAEYMGV